MSTGIELTDPTRRSWSHDGPRPIRLTVWEPEPALGGPAPLALISHGTGGSIETLDWLGDALSAAGWLVVGVDHHGNTAVERYLPEGFAFIWERPRDLSFALDWAIAERAVDAARIAAVGYSLGGYSVAALAGARVNPHIAGAVLAGHVPVPPLPEYPTLIEDLAAAYSPAELADAVAAGGADLRDSRVSRIAMLAPAVGQLVAPESLQGVSIPALVLWGAADVVAEPHANALAYVAGIEGAQGVDVGDVGHEVFRSDADQSDGAQAVRAEVAARVVDFLDLRQ